MQTLQINLPDTLDMSQQEVTVALAAQLYGMGKLSLGQAAELTGYSKVAFMEMLSQYGVSLLNYVAEEIDNDLANAKNYHC